MDDHEISPVTRSSEQTRQSYNRLSRWYDVVAGSEKKFTETGLKLLDVRPDESVLEIGFGTGHALVEIAKAGAQVSGVDISEGMLSIARKRVDAAVPGNHVELEIEDARHLSFKDGSFDAIFTSFVLELFDTPEIPSVLRECRRVLRPNGRITVVALEKKATTACRLYEWGHAKFPALLDCRPIQARKFIEEAGFMIASDRENSMWGLPVAIVSGCNPA